MGPLWIRTKKSLEEPSITRCSTSAMEVKWGGPRWTPQTNRARIKLAQKSPRNRPKIVSSISLKSGSSQTLCIVWSKFLERDISETKDGTELRKKEILNCQSGRVPLPSTFWQRRNNLTLWTCRSVGHKQLRSPLPSFLHGTRTCWVLLLAFIHTPLRSLVAKSQPMKSTLRSAKCRPSSSSDSTYRSKFSNSC